MKNYQFYLLFVSLLFISCDFSNKTDPDRPEEEKEEVVTLEELGELIEVDSTLEAVPLYEYGLPFEALPLDDSTYLFQGDILIDVEDLATPLEEGQPIPKTGTARTKGLWTNNTMFYQINPALDATLQTRIREAIKIWQGTNPNLKFVEGKGIGAFVMFTSGSGCASGIGMSGRQQAIMLSTRCSTGSIVHEIGHSWGLWHEQSRADRDKHLKINYENITPGMEHNFKTYIQMGWDGQELTPMDFGSIMMYPPYGFSKNGLPTITKADGTIYTIQRSRPSPLDIEAMNKLYPAVTTTEPTKPTPEPEPTKPTKPEIVDPAPTPPAPVYVNGQFYLYQGLYVMRNNDRWYYLYKQPTGNGYTYWREVVWRNNRWYYS